MKKGHSNRQTGGGTAAKVKQPDLIPQPHGGALLSGGKPGNAGGGRLRERLFELAHERSVEVLEEFHAREITYTLNGVCSHCGEKSTGPETFGDLLKVVPSHDVRLRAAEIPLRYTLGRESIIRLEGHRDIQKAFNLMEHVIRRFAPDTADTIMQQITTELKQL